MRLLNDICPRATSYDCTKKLVEVRCEPPALILGRALKPHPVRYQRRQLGHPCPYKLTKVVDGVFGNRPENARMRAFSLKKILTTVIVILALNDRAAAHEFQVVLHCGT